MIRGQATFGIGMLLIGSGLAPTTAKAQDVNQSCTGPLTEQLRRLSEQCISDVIGYVASQPAMGARISGESEKFYVIVVKDAKGFRAEAVSKFNYPLVQDEVFDNLKRLGWPPPKTRATTGKGRSAPRMSAQPPRMWPKRLRRMV